MASADHSQFQFAAERYILGELPEEEKLAFEEHYFSCGTCAQDVEILTQLRLAAPAVLPLLDRGVSKSRFVSWFTRPWVPRSALGALAVMTLVSCYQNAVEIPRLKAASDDGLQIMAAPRPLLATRGGGTLTVPGLPKMVPFLIANEWPVSYRSYMAHITRHGASVALLRAEAEVANGSLLIAVPARKLGAGIFDLIISGIPVSGEPKELEKYPFTIQGE